MSKPQYTSKREHVTEYIEQTFFPTDGEHEPIAALPRADLNLQLLRQYGASQGVVDSILEIYVHAGVLKVTDKKVYRPDLEI